jgi:biopolymer transport protein ExbD
MRKSESRRVYAEINMVPFIDVVLVLLVIFMVTTPLLIQGQIRVKLPKATSPSMENMGPATVTISADGTVYFRDQPVLMEQLVGLLKPVLAVQTDKVVIINADRSTTHGRVVGVLDAARQAGADRLAIATDQVK